MADEVSVTILGLRELEAQLEGMSLESSAGAEKASVTSDLDYPYYLEYGTRYMTARPSAEPAWDAAEPAMSAEIDAAVGAAIDQMKPVPPDTIEKAAETYAREWEGRTPYRTGAYRASIRVEPGISE